MLEFLHAPSGVGSRLHRRPTLYPRALCGHGRCRLHLRFPAAQTICGNALRGAEYEFAMGSRWRGSIEPGAMPWLHQHVGTPITTWILNLVYGCQFTDIHCGMRGISRDAFERMGLMSQSWNTRVGDGAEVRADGTSDDRGSSHLLQGQRWPASPTTVERAGSLPSMPRGSTCVHLCVWRRLLGIQEPGLVLHGSSDYSSPCP